MMKKGIALLQVFIFILASTSICQVSEEALRQWRQQKFSLFIHWGIYSELGGVWENRHIARGLSEQIQAHAGIYSDTYAAVAKRFRPVHWNPDSIALLARNSGMRSIIFTSKHHDGFSMFDTDATEFNVVDATPYGRDVVGELAEACRKQGLKFGLYFSLIDWHYPQAAPISSHNSDPITPEHHAFNLKQVAELLTRYGPISELWFDMGSHTAEQSREMQQLVRKLQPDCMIGSRIGNDRGDFTVMSDNQEPTYIIGVPWQSPASFFHETWGYRSWQERPDANAKYREKLESLIRVVSRGGNYLLNIGPRGDGSVVEYERDILLRIGGWLQKNGEAIYGTEPDPFEISFPWGNITSRPRKLYLNLLSAPSQGLITLPAVNGKVKSAYLLGDSLLCAVSRNKTDLEIRLPDGVDIQTEIPVVVVEFEEEFQTAPLNVVQVSRGTRLDADNSFKFFSNSGIDYNTRYQSTVREHWTLTSAKTFTAEPVLEYTEEERGRALEVNTGGGWQTVLLDGKETLPLKNNLSGLRKGKKFLLGPLYSGVEGVHDSIGNINPAAPWSRNKEARWKEFDEIESRTFPAGMMSAYYLLQEIDSPIEQEVLFDILRGEGVAVFLNGKQVFIHLDSLRRDSLHNTLLFQLRKGRNEVLVKVFNNFSKRVAANLEVAKEQVLYRTKLPAMIIRKNAFVPFSWRPANAVSPHQDLMMPNVRVRM